MSQQPQTATKKVVKLCVGMDGEQIAMPVAPADNNKTLNELFLELAEDYEKRNKRAEANNWRSMLTNHEMFYKGTKLDPAMKLGDLSFDLTQEANETYLKAVINIQEISTGG